VQAGLERRQLHPRPIEEFERSGDAADCDGSAALALVLQKNAM
jgi:hypothetical protein